MLAQASPVRTPWIGQAVGGLEAAEPAQALVLFTSAHLRAGGAGESVAPADAHDSSSAGSIGLVQRQLHVAVHAVYLHNATNAYRVKEPMFWYVK
jgi:hypothetical protein